jgi:hypothetical protein
MTEAGRRNYWCACALILSRRAFESPRADRRHSCRERFDTTALTIHLPDRPVRRLSLWMAALATAIGTGAHAAEENQQVNGPLPQYEIVSQGLLGSPLVPIQFKTANLRLEIRDLILGRTFVRTLPATTRTILEVRGGAVTATLNGQTKTYVPGDWFVIEEGDVLEMRNKGDVTVIRAIYVFEQAK